MSGITTIEGADARAIADWLAERLRVAGGRDVAISVPGGSTPFPIFEALVTGDVDFTRLAVWPNDDRIVAEDHEASNTGRIRAIFEPVGAKVVALSEGLAPPRFELVWLGMGEDGHVASLFPNTDPRADDPLPIRRLTPDPLPPHAPFDRITLTLPSLLATQELMFVIRGEEKRGVFEAAAGGRTDLPVARLLGAARARGIPVTLFA
ncbi:MAG: 6-phosphogluconolactonase [Erythrobacter sp.]